MSEESTPGESVLLVHEGFGDHDTTSCLRRLAVDDPEMVGLIRVTYTSSELEFVDDFAEVAGGRPAMAIEIRVESTIGRPDDADDDPDVAVRTVNPNDLTGLGMRLRDALETIDDQQLRPALCFDSVTSLLQYNDLDNAFRFLHMLNAHLSRQDARSHFHVQRGAHEDQAIHTLQGVFDRVEMADQFE